MVFVFCAAFIFWRVGGAGSIDKGVLVAQDNTSILTNVFFSAFRYEKP
jgi:hypothetical protein